MVQPGTGSGETTSRAGPGNIQNPLLVATVRFVHAGRIRVTVQRQVPEEPETELAADPGAIATMLDSRGGVRCLG